MQLNCPECLTQNCTGNIVIKNGQCLSFRPDKISLLSHRLYRGLILPALCDFMGETNRQYTHDFKIKPEFVYRQTGEYYYKFDKYEDIPVKHQKDSKIWIEGNIFAMIPSMKTFTKKETKDFLLFTDALLFEIGGNIDPENNTEYMTLKSGLLK
jgi:hypothetical protein